MNLGLCAVWKCISSATSNGYCDRHQHVLHPLYYKITSNQKGITMIICCICQKEINDNKYHRAGSITLCMNCYSEWSENMKKIDKQSDDRIGEMPGFMQGAPQLVTPTFDKKPFTTSRSKNLWEEVTDTITQNEEEETYSCSFTYRLKVFGGWLVNTFGDADGTLLLSTVFVPDPNHEWVIRE